MLSCLCLAEEQDLTGEQSNFQQVCLSPPPLPRESITAQFGTRDDVADVLHKLFLLKQGQWEHPSLLRASLPISAPGLLLTPPRDVKN